MSDNFAWARVAHENADRRLRDINSVEQYTIGVGDEWFARVADAWDDMLGDDDGVDNVGVGLVRTHAAFSMFDMVPDAEATDAKWLYQVDVALRATAIDSARRGLRKSMADSDAFMLNAIGALLNEYMPKAVTDIEPADAELRERMPGKSLFFLLDNIVLGISINNDASTFLHALAPATVSTHMVPADVGL